jgi:hypothetical protein
LTGTRIFMRQTVPFPGFGARQGPGNPGLFAPATERPDHMQGGRFVSNG